MNAGQKSVSEESSDDDALPAPPAVTKINRDVSIGSEVGGSSWGVTDGAPTVARGRSGEGTTSSLDGGDLGVISESEESPEEDGEGDKDLEPIVDLIDYPGMASLCYLGGKDGRIHCIDVLQLMKKGRGAETQQKRGRRNSLPTPPAELPEIFSLRA